MKEYKISELGKIARGKSKHRPRNDKILYSGEYPFIQTGDVKKANLYIDKHSNTYNEVGLKQSKLWDKGTLCITIAANIADTAILKYSACFPDSIIGFQAYEDSSDVRYIKYYFDIYKKHMESISMGATQNNLSVAKLESITFKVHKLEEQTKIADVLSTYDTLIENNNRRIQILEQTAEELYKEWFVRMRFPGYENTKFDKGIPEGWEVQKLSGLIRVTDGTHDTPKEVTDGVPLVTGRNIINGQIDFNTTYNISKEDHKKINVRSSIEKYDVLYSNIGTIGQMAIVHNDNKYSVKNLIILKTSQYDCYEYIYLHFKNEACQRHFDSIASGASQKFISLTEMRNYKILIPKKETLEQFKIYVSNLFNQIVLLSNQNQNLIKQRDLLLPRLMNGTIIVK